MHGIRTSENPESNPASVRLWLELLDTGIQNIKQGSAFEIAETIDRSFVTSRNLRMMFLRANRYDPQASAVQVIKYFELKRSLFGRKKLTKKITLADLSNEAKDFLESGAVQISTKRDRSGRGILLLFPSLGRRDTKVEALLTARYYVFMNMIESSEDHQMNGIVLVYFGALASQPNQHASNSGLLWDLPIFYAGLHGCFSELSSYLLVSVAVLRLPFSLRPRLRVHYGSCTDCIYKLSSFGIPREALLTDSDEPRLVEHLEWYRQKQELELATLAKSETEMQSLTSPGTIIPQRTDVLFGPGSKTNDGNLLMRKLVLAVLAEYNDSTKMKKMQLTENIMDEIKKTGGRFLRQQDKMWEEVTHREACRKIAHTFRNIRRPSRAKRKL